MLSCRSLRGPIKEAGFRQNTAFEQYEVASRSQAPEVNVGSQAQLALTQAAQGRIHLWYNNAPLAVSIACGQNLLKQNGSLQVRKRLSSWLAGAGCSSTVVPAHRK